MNRSRRRRRHQGSEELDIKTFMNLMVILVPFLLVTAVFSQTSVIKLDLPVSNSATASSEPTLALEVVVRAGQIEVGDRNAGMFSVIPNVDGKYDVAALTTKLMDVKATFPDETAVTLLLESDINYESMVSVMDAIRSYLPDQPGVVQRSELFPEISIGDAPVMVAANR